MIVKAAKQRRTNILSSIEELRKHTEQFGCVFSDPTLARGPNRDLMVEVERVVAQCSTSMMAHVDAFCSEFDTANKTLKVLLATLFEKHREQELGFQAIIDRDNRAREQSHARASLERQKHDLLQKKRVCAEHRVELQEQELHRKRLLRQLRELEDQRFSVREAVAHRINAKLSPGVQVNVTQYANADQYQNRLEDALRNARIQRRVVARKLAGAICPTQLAHIVRERDTETLVARGNLNRDQAEMVIQTLCPPEVICAIESTQLGDLPCIELKVGSVYKDSGSLSTGQKCTTILSLLLLESCSPLFIDQPEDNLDNRFIYETIVESIRRVKQQRQLIFVTHNPNIPVLGDADRLFALEPEDNKSRLAYYGTVDELKSQVVQVLEGGEEAFKARKTRYSY